MRHVKFTNRITNIYSDNGTGKTSILEALFLFNSSNSFHKVHNKNLISINKSNMSIHYNIEKDNIKYNVKSNFQLNNSSIYRSVYLDDKKTTLTTLNQLLKITYFIPQMFTFFTHFPEHRRSFIDRLTTINTSQSNNKNYTENIKKFNKLSYERQETLNNHIGHLALEEIELELSNLFIEIMKERINTAIKLQQSLLKLESEDLPKLTIILYIKLPIVINSINYLKESDSLEQTKIKIEDKTLKTQILLLFAKSRYNDRLNKTPSIHLNLFDLITINRINKLNAKYFSTGEQKMALLTLLIAQEGNILLLDEIASFLDEKNYTKIWKILEKQNAQIISTSTKALDTSLATDINNIQLKPTN